MTIIITIIITIITIRTYEHLKFENDVFLPYYLGDDNVWKWSLLSHKRHHNHYAEILLI